MCTIEHGASENRGLLLGIKYNVRHLYKMDF